MPNSADQKRVPHKILYDQRPNYTRPALELSEQVRGDLLAHLTFLYGQEKAQACMPELERIIKVHHAFKSQELRDLQEARDPKHLFSHKDMILITYGDMISDGGGTPLAVLAKACDEHMLAPDILHILPFFPYSSDRGFSVVDFTKVDPRLGTWEDIHHLAGRYRLMFDGVLNHISAHSDAFHEFLDGNPDYQDFFIAYASPDELTPDQRSKIFRPRVSDILTPFMTINGVRYLWTTFSPDQIDLNYRNPKVLLSVVEALLFYIRQGADLLHLDAVTYIWAEPGTECIHLAQTHEIVKLLRTVVEAAAPGVALVTETNVPHADNVSYFGSGLDEAHMVYNFALPPLVLHAVYRQDASRLAAWAAELEPPSEATAFFNILDTHDGIGLMGVKQILPPEEIDFIVQCAQANGALVSMKTVEGGGEEPYEINSTWWSVINPHHGEDHALQLDRYLASRAVALSLKGVPGVYLHGALGTSSDLEAYRRTGHNRDVNRGTVDLAVLAAEANDPSSRLGRLAPRMSHLNVTRVSQKAFHPRGSQKVLKAPEAVLALLRVSPDGDERLLSLINLSASQAAFSLELPAEAAGAGAWHDLVRPGEAREKDGALEVEMKPYQVMWLRPQGEPGAPE
ncbi:MAG: sugar phosphorylase [Desulfarculus sp.]|nr:sugar phosphorylase [Pseudomonadota bacterium]MBV1716194.1 sugar phosphorylase [Desulfarculus sp.]MBU4574219.1 sugar phosphorylase [Pseudomonadota bacterium]MBU4599776.1 sugar phosphorylase [Pseudomonadota bacterium]MBV1738151.1 sugar phosphorylase [Desulfarculus sp.]